MRRRRLALLALVTATLGLTACKKEPPPESSVVRTNAADGTQPASAPSGAQAVVTGRAEVGKSAPDFALKDLDGKELRLSQFKGKVVVLEWFNPGCPFVKRAHTKGSLKDAAKRHAKEGVVWIAVNSTSERSERGVLSGAAVGKEGNGVDRNREAAKTFGMDHPIVIDESGDVGHAYGATNTPNMFVIDPKGTLVYRGAIDNSPDGEGESAPDGKLVSYVDEALASIASGKPVAVAETKAYGCSVKYAAH